MVHLSPESEHSASKIWPSARSEEVAQLLYFEAMWAVVLCLLIGTSSAAPQSTSTTPRSAATGDRVRHAYQAGEKALQDGDLALAQQSFALVLRLLPDDVGARVNLAVVLMREKQWDGALRYLQEAQTRAPGITGIRLNIGLIEYRKGDYAAAIPAFESVLHEQPDSAQARHLLGLCYLFDERYADAAAALEPLWPASNTDLSYLYSLAVAAGNAKQHDWEERSLSRMMEIGSDSPLLHVLHGKADLAHEDFSGALNEFETAARQDAKLPLVHYNLGVVYRRQGQLEKAQEEFLRDIALAPGMAYDYDQLGAISYTLQRNQSAESYFRDALKLNPKLGTSWFGLAKVYKQEKRYPQALNAIEQAFVIDPNSGSAHYLRAQILIEMGRNKEAQDELSVVRRVKRESLDKLQQALNGPGYRDPEVTQRGAE